MPSADIPSTPLSPPFLHWSCCHPPWPGSRPHRLAVISAKSNMTHCPTEWYSLSPSAWRPQIRSGKCSLLLRTIGVSGGACYIIICQNTDNFLLHRFGPPAIPHRDQIPSLTLFSRWLDFRTTCRKHIRWITCSYWSELADRSASPNFKLTRWERQRKRKRKRESADSIPPKHPPWNCCPVFARLWMTRAQYHIWQTL